MTMRILKFGGSSVRDADTIGRVLAIVAGARADALAGDRSGQAASPEVPVGMPVVVVSALGGVTDTLDAAVACAEARDDEFRAHLANVIARHREAADALTHGDERAAIDDTLQRAEADLGEMLQGIYLLREASARARDAVTGYGERLSSELIAAALRCAGTPASTIHGEKDTDGNSCPGGGELIVTDACFGAARVDHEATEQRIRARFADLDPAVVPVVPGFVATTRDGQPTTLGRGGSDYTASLLGAALGASAVELWTDVDAVMTADPNLVPDARPIRQLRYVELLELCHFGAKVVYPPAVHPSRKRGIPLLIRNTFQPEAPYTTVTAKTGPAEADAPSDARPERAVRGISSIPRIALVRLEGDGMVGVPGIAGRLFQALSRAEVNVVLISQASSEHSICFAIVRESVDAAAQAIDQEFALERRVGMIDRTVIEDDMAVVAVVGAGMRERPGIAGRLFRALGAAAVNVRAIAQGSSELNVSLVVRAEDRERAVIALHQAFLEDATAHEGSAATAGVASRDSAGRSVVRVAVAGVGGVGSALFEQIASVQGDLRSQGTDLRLVAVGTRAGWLHDPEGIDPGTAVTRARAAADPTTPDTMHADLSAIRSSPSGIDLFVDVTASAQIANLYTELLAAGIAVVAANKLRLAGSQAEYEHLMATAQGRLLHETTVGAGLPVIGTLNDLIASGDRIRRIEGTLSGTLGFLASELAEGAPLSQAVRKAYDLGYTEPDPREDLAGRDAARKILILARLAGHALEPEDIAVESLLPDALAEVSLDVLWDELPALDADIAARTEAAHAKGHALAFRAVFDEQGARLGLDEVPADHPCAAARGTDNVIVFTTDRYADTPLVVQGPGAGREVTAAGVLADMMRVVRARAAQSLHTAFDPLPAQGVAP